MFRYVFQYRHYALKSFSRILEEGPVTYAIIPLYAEQRVPFFHTPRMLSVWSMSWRGLPSTKTRSALSPSAILPLSLRRNLLATSAVPALNASFGVKPHSLTSTANSWCAVRPKAVPCAGPAESDPLDEYLVTSMYY